MSDFDALIVGAGPSGLAAAIAIRKRLEANVVLIEREREAGGIARHTNHSGYGWRDFHRVMRGPAYVQRYQTLADKAGVELRLSTSAVEWTGDRSLKLVSAGGVEDVTARSIVLATGCRERSRPARLIAGDRPDGVLTTGMLQQLVELYGARAGAPGSPIGHRAVVIGAEHVSFSAVMTLRHAGCTTAAMVTDLGRHQSAAALRWSAAPRVRIH